MWKKVFSREGKKGKSTFISQTDKENKSILCWKPTTFSGLLAKNGFFYLLPKMAKIMSNPSKNKWIIDHANQLRKICCFLSECCRHLSERCLFIPGHTMGWFCTMWKFDFFSVTQILHEIQLGDLDRSKNWHFDILFVWNFAFGNILNNFVAFYFNFQRFWQFLKAKIYQNQYPKPLKTQNSRFQTSRIAEINFTFTENLHSKAIFGIS